MNNKIDFLTIKEKREYELKEASINVPKSIYETMSAFANTNGGTIILGLKESTPLNIISGVKNAEQYKKDILNTTNNKTKFSYPIISDEDFETIEFMGKTILVIHVCEAPKTVKPVYLNGSLNESFGRNGDGDYCLKKNQIKYFLNDNNDESYDALPNTRNYAFEDVNIQTLKSYRQYLNAAFPDNIYTQLDDEAFLIKTGSLVKNSNNQYVLTNAAVIMFTNHSMIVSLFPNYLLDYQRNTSDITKWDNRYASDEPTWSGNLFDFYKLVIDDLFKDVPSSYVSINGKNIGPALMRDCVKEALANAFSNHSFFLSIPLSITRKPDELIVRNSGKMIVSKERAIEGGISAPRNSGIMTFFRRIGVSDRAGTGIPKMFLAMEQNNYKAPVITEYSEPEDYTVLKLLFTPKQQSSFTPIEEKIIELVSSTNNKGVSLPYISLKLNISRSYTSKLINRLIANNVLADNGKSAKGRLIFIKE